MENFDLILVVSNLVTYESHDEKRVNPTAEKSIERDVMRGMEAKPYCSSQKATLL